VTPEAQAAQGAERPPRLIYLLGAARSGSTIIGACLGRHPGILAVGELAFMLAPDRGDPRVCSCGKLVPDCPLWGRVLAAWGSDAGSLRPDRYRRAQRNFEHVRNLPRLLREILRPSREFGIYAEDSRRLVAVLGSVSGTRILVDSSKHPVRALALRLAGVTDLTLIHIVRDPRAVVWSTIKIRREYPVGPRLLRSDFAVALRACLDWIFLNLLSHAVARRIGGPTLRLRYEDFVQDPARELVRLEPLLGVELESVAAGLANDAPIGYGHIVAGNRARRRGPRPLVLDTDWHVRAPLWSRRLAWLACGPLARRYAYR